MDSPFETLDGELADGRVNPVTLRAAINAMNRRLSELSDVVLDRPIDLIPVEPDPDVQAAPGQKASKK